MGSSVIEPNARAASFLCYLCKKLLVYACVVTACLIALAVLRKVLSSKYEILLDNVMVASAFAFLSIFGFRLIKAWFKSSSKEVRLTQEKLVYCAIGSFFILIIAALCFVVIYMFLIKLKYPDLNQRGVFGDSFGALNSIVSTVALIGLWLTVWLQFREAQEDRKRGLEHDEKERRWREEELRNQRRSFWLVLILSHVSGEIGSLSFTKNGSLALSGQIRLGYKNISDVPLFNVAMLTHYQSAGDSKSISSAGGPIVPYIEDDSAKEKRFDLDFVERHNYAIKLSNAFIRGRERAIDVQIIFSTAQGFCYCLDESLYICLAHQSDMVRLKNWDEAIEFAFNARSNQTKDIGQMRMQILENALKKHGAAVTDKIELAFETQPLKHEIREITKEVYNSMIATCPYPVIKGGI